MLYISNIDAHLKQGLLETLLLILGFTLAAIYAMAIGGNDTANSVANPFGGGVASYNKLLLIFTISVFLGAILQEHMVIKTLGKGVVSDLDLYAALAASLAGITWVFTATYLGLPVSTSQSVTGGVIGSGIAMIIVLGKSVELNTRVIVDIIVS
jgi:Phosphate/sulphate permeases